MKAIKILLITILGTVAIALTTFLVLVLTGKIDLKDFPFKGVVSKEKVFEQEYENIFSELNIESEAGNIELKTSTNDKIKVVVYGEKDRTEVVDTEKALTIKTTTKKCNFLCFNTTISRVEVYLPAEFTADIDIDTKYGDIKAETVANIEASTNYGDIKIEKALEYFEVETNYGDIKISDLVITKDSKAETNFGDIKVGMTNDVRIEADTDLGDVKVANYHSESNITLSLETNLGDIKVNN